MTTTDVVRRTIDEDIVPGKRLGRHVEHDPRSWDFQAEQAPAVVDVTHAAFGLPLDQGKTGSCTAQALCGAANCQPNYSGALAWPHIDKRSSPATEADAIALYTKETTDEGQPYPAYDPGGTGLAVCRAARELGWLSRYAWAFTFDQALRALVMRPAIIGCNWYDCVAPDQRVLTPDLRWVPIQKLSPGDEVIGFDEHGRQDACYRRAVVISNALVVKDALEIVTDHGTVSTSTGHLFLVTSAKAARRWVRADQLQPGDWIQHMMDPYEQDLSWEAGWLAGFFDGEGTLSGYRCDVGQVVGPTLDRLKGYMAAKGYDFRVQRAREATDRWQEVHNMTVAGGYAGAMRFLGEVRPERLLAKSAMLWEGRSVRGRTNVPAIVQQVNRLGRHEVYAIGTTAKTLVVEGLLSHNSFDYPDGNGVVTITPGAYVRGGHEIVATSIDTQRQLVGFWNSWGLWGPLRGRFFMSYATLERLLGEQGDFKVPGAAIAR